MFLDIINHPMRYASILLFAGLYAFALANWGTPHVVGAAYLVASAACFIGCALPVRPAARWRAALRL